MAIETDKRDERCNKMCRYSKDSSSFFSSGRFADICLSRCHITQRHKCDTMIGHCHPDICVPAALPSPAITALGSL